MTRKEAAKRLKKLVEVYKRYLVMTDDTQPGKVKQWTRYSVVQYLCSFSKLDPDEIAAALIREGIEVRFDDSSISAADNAKHQRRVMRRRVSDCCGHGAHGWRVTCRSTGSPRLPQIRGSLYGSGPGGGGLAPLPTPLNDRPPGAAIPAE